METIPMRRGALPQPREMILAAWLWRAIGARLRELLERLPAAAPDPPPEFFRQPFP